MLSRSSSAAISAMGVLAQCYAEGTGPLTAVEIGRRCGVPGPFVAKLLVVLSRHGLVRGARGRQGGYGLMRAPQSIVLFDVTQCFERVDKLEDCPFGFGHCGRDPVCPLHRKLEPVRRALREFLERTTLAEYVGSEAVGSGVQSPKAARGGRASPARTEASKRARARGVSQPRAEVPTRARARGASHAGGGGRTVVAAAVGGAAEGSRSGPAKRPPEDGARRLR